MTPNKPDSTGPGEMPPAFGQNKLVLLAINPYMLHSYWELGTPPAGSDGWAILRLYEESPSGEECRPTDVEVSLAAGNWYIHLWSTDKVYYAELGLREEDGSFLAFARSNEIRTPAAGPQEHARGSQPEYLTTKVPPEEISPAAAPIMLSDETAIEASTAAAPAPSSIDASVILQQYLAELCAIRGEQPPADEPAQIALEPAASVPFQLDKLRELDLTQYSEERFAPGVSSPGVSGPGVFATEGWFGE